ncbi:MAG: recombinase RecQ, partial [Mycobacterium sp.]
VLAAWDWTDRPTGVMALESSTHPTLVRSLSAKLAQVGRLTDLGVLHLRPEHPPVSAANSAYRVAGLVDAWDVPDMSAHQGPVLLVDALADTGWTFTMAARALRQAGAQSVLPLALASPK